MQLAILGLGKMGRNLAEKLMSEGHQVVIWNRSRDVLEQFRTEKSAFIVSQKLQIAHSLEDLRDTLQHPRIVWSMLPAGDPTEGVMTELLEGIVEQGDIVVDGGNAFYQDTERRSKAFEAKGIKFLGIGVSGGLHGLANGYPLMVGGNQSGYEYIKPILDSLAKPNGNHTYFGPGGAGHFVKMVHNGVEYGMMQAIAEGFGVMAKSDYHLNLVNVGNNWQKGSIVSSFLVYMAVSSLIKDPGLTQFDGYIDAKGEGKWTVETAKATNVPTPVMEAALDFRNKSQFDKAVQETFVAKMVSALRHEFGGHPTTAPVATESTTPEASRQG
jgi:6-phosphogluconate dehydrogenase